MRSGYTNFNTEVIVLKRRNFGDSDRIITFLSRDFGKVTYIAKGVRLPKSRKRGHLEPFSHARISTSGHDPSKMNVITEAQVMENFAEVKNNLTRSSFAYFIVECVLRLTQEHEENRELFDMTISYLRKLTKTAKLKNLRREFTIDILVLLGFWPEGRQMPDPDLFLESVAEHKFTSVRVGKIVLR